MINNSNRTEWSPLQCVIIQEINKMGWPHTSIWLKTELDDTKFCYQLIMTITKFVMFQAFQNQNIGNFFNSKKKSHLSALVWWHVLSNYLGMTCTVLLHCPISAEIRTADSQSDLRILLNLWLNLSSCKCLLRLKELWTLWFDLSPHSVKWQHFWKVIMALLFLLLLLTLTNSFFFRNYSKESAYFSFCK